MMIVAFSGGADSTALALELAQRSTERIGLLHTPTGDELPGVAEHVRRVLDITGGSLILPEGPSLYELICRYKALPNWRMRWCTREIKIEPCIRWLKRNPGHTLAVGLRADETSRKGGIYGRYVTQVYPLQEWGWNRQDVLDKVEQAGLCVPKRTDCALCFWQRMGEWHDLWLNHPDHWEWGEQLEEWTGRTWRSPNKKSKWDPSMVGLRKQFESGMKPRKSARQIDLLGSCRVCKM